ncbi:MAG TPA: hypothetical protein VHH91_03720, partial [Vicinamibacterales bacterium]|nr:hypothetical protein [Vicinamibacterales bacterium]
MSDDLLATLDDRFAAARDRATALTSASPAALAAHARFRPMEQQAAARVSLRDRWPWLEWFVCAQFLWG